MVDIVVPSVRPAAPAHKSLGNHLMGAAQLNLFEPSGEGNQLHQIIRHFETSGPLTADSKYLRAYDDVKQMSIGYGTEVGLMARKLGLDEGKLRSGALTITPEQAEKVMQDELAEIRNDVIAKLKRYEKAAGHPYTKLNDDAIDALTSFTYNLGPGNLNTLTDNGNRDLAKVFEMIPAYNKAENKEGVKVRHEGLARRRQSEQAVFKKALTDDFMPISPNDNTSSNDSIGQQMASMASSQQDSRTLSEVMLPPTPSRRLPTWLDIDTSPEEMRRRVREERKKPAYSIGAMIHAAMTGQQFGSPDYDPDLKVILRH